MTSTCVDVQLEALARSNFPAILQPLRVECVTKYMGVPRAGKYSADA